MDYSVEMNTCVAHEKKNVHFKTLVLTVSGVIKFTKTIEILRLTFTANAKRQQTWCFIHAILECATILSNHKRSQ